MALQEELRSQGDFLFRRRSYLPLGLLAAGLCIEFRQEMYDSMAREGAVAEESFLREKFGRTYLEWSAQTPIFLPRRFSYVRPETGFNWRKVLRNEKNGLVALSLVLCLFGLTGDLAEGHVSCREERPSIIAAIGAIWVYIAIKTLSKCTTALDERGSPRP